MAFNNFPYLNLNTLNLDWFIDVAKSLDTLFDDIAPVWNDTKTYMVNDIVFWNNQLWICLQNDVINIQPISDHTKWQQVRLAEVIKNAL